MNKIIMSMLLLLSINLSAKTVENNLASYKKSCKNGSMTGCINLGILYFTGDGVKENPKKAKKIFEKACKKRYPQACYYLGIMYKRGAEGVDKNIKRSKLFYGRACQIGYVKACDQYNLLREKPEVKGSGKNVINSGYTYTPEIYGG